MKKKSIQELIFGFILIVCSVLIIVELKNNLFSKDQSHRTDNLQIYEEDSLANDSLIPYKQEWDPSVPDYLRQEY